MDKEIRALRKLEKKNRKEIQRMRKTGDYRIDSNLSITDVSDANATLISFADTDHFQTLSRDIIRTSINHQTMSIQATAEQLYAMDFGVGNWKRNYISIPVMVILYLGIHTKDTGSIEFGLVNKAYKDSEDQLEISNKSCLGDMTVFIAKPNITMHREDVTNWVLRTRIQNAKTENVIVGEMMILWRFTESDLPIQFARGDSFAFKFDPQDDAISARAYGLELADRFAKISNKKKEMRDLTSLINPKFLKPVDTQPTLYNMTKREFSGDKIVTNYTPSSPSWLFE
ncbi:nonstructural protein 4 [Fitzroy Crossing tenui-like virus 1]|uniref:Nonstructural protein 4 n=1 Tax=Fitzroy Crossing tenui-like virus 1 TaxID=2755159 RepID=A0A7D5Y179_9VIRU|nr:nonstructural protein 4 [Fitzroy Crossing tenui-like virus 1]QLJ83471.1 nonstructural protein 4 [Fitzroy Crossing tenui-like virus 1]